jgi:hypothetical protein
MGLPRSGGLCDVMRDPVIPPPPAPLTMVIFSIGSSWSYLAVSTFPSASAVRMSYAAVTLASIG